MKLKVELIHLKEYFLKILEKPGGKIADNYELLQDKGVEAAESVKERMHDVYDSNYYDESIEKVELFAKRKPFIVIGLVFVLGMFISKFKDK